MKRTVIKPTKYGNNKPFAFGRVWDSNKELARYCELLLLEKAGLITELETQPRFLIVDTVRGYGRTLCKRYYSADFGYYEVGKSKKVIEDVKCVATAEDKTYRLKRQIFLDKYGSGLDFREIIDL